jgi:hypothetical protein
MSLPAVADPMVVVTKTRSAPEPGRITVFADDLAEGLYTYALVIDDKMVDSKKMLRSSGLRFTRPRNETVAHAAHA